MSEGGRREHKIYCFKTSHLIPPAMTLCYISTVIIIVECPTPIFKEAEGQQISERKYLERLKNEDFGTTKLGKLRSYCWNVTEYPETSLAARVGWSRLELWLDNNLLVVTFNFR